MQGQRVTRERIVGAAMELFWLKGYGSTSIADILSRTQLNSGSLYHFFPGKQDLLLAVLETYRAGIAPMLLEPAWAVIDDPIERVFALLARYRGLILESDCTYGRPLWHALDPRQHPLRARRQHPRRDASRGAHRRADPGRRAHAGRGRAHAALHARPRDRTLDPGRGGAKGADPCPITFTRTMSSSARGRRDACSPTD
ncbi:MAG: TetR/AcrR family transcriptional regulator [Rhizorhabdus sp.]|nr:TetR/AcrR family transcriptional regulator [Rhizorhabdus sp.]